MRRRISLLVIALVSTGIAAPLCRTDAQPGPPGAAVGDAYPAAGRRVDVNFGAMAFRLDFLDRHRMTFHATAGKPVTDTVDYTAHAVRPGLYMVYWHEPKTGNNVVHVQDFAAGTVYTNIAQPDGQFLHLHGTLHLVPRG